MNLWQDKKLIMFSAHNFNSTCHPPISWASHYNSENSALHHFIRFPFEISKDRFTAMQWLRIRMHNHSADLCKSGDYHLETRLRMFTLNEQSSDSWHCSSLSRSGACSVCLRGPGCPDHSRCRSRRQSRGCPGHSPSQSRGRRPGRVSRGESEWEERDWEQIEYV